MQEIKKRLDSFIDRVFSLKKENLILFVIVLLGFILRFIATRNIIDDADSLHFVTHAINFLSAGRLETYAQTSGLWSALTSIFYNLFGVNSFSSRLASLIFGTFTIFVLYLLTEEFFKDKKISLTAAS